MKTITKQFTCETCGNKTMLKVQHCPKCLSELAKYELSSMSLIRCEYELKIIDRLPEATQERYEQYQNQLNKRHFQLSTGH